MIFLLKMMETINLELLEDQSNYRLSEMDHKKIILVKISTIFN